MKLEVSAILIEYCEYFEDAPGNIYFHFAVKQSQKRTKERKWKIRHLTHQIRHLQSRDSKDEKKKISEEVAKVAKRKTSSQQQPAAAGTKTNM